MYEAKQFVRKIFKLDFPKYDRKINTLRWIIGVSISLDTYTLQRKCLAGIPFGRERSIVTFEIGEIDQPFHRMVLNIKETYPLCLLSKATRYQNW